MAASGIRYVDNFIDEALWPELERWRTGNVDMKRKIEERFKKFLKSCLRVVMDHDPYMPEEIIQLPQIELHLTLFPDQETFDANIKDYFFQKSFDLAYLDHLLYRTKSVTPEKWSEEERLRFMLIAIDDVSRDMEGAGVDFDVFRHIDDNNIDPSTLVDFLEKILKQSAPNTFTYYAAAVDPYFHTDALRDYMDMDNLSNEDKLRVISCVNMIRYLKNGSMAKEEDDDDEYDEERHD